jgi:hypothetical protein
LRSELLAVVESPALDRQARACADRWALAEYHRQRAARVTAIDEQAVALGLASKEDASAVVTFARLLDAIERMRRIDAKELDLARKAARPVRRSALAMLEPEAGGGSEGGEGGEGPEEKGPNPGEAPGGEWP